jgi:putative addiction module component (TIGR02574 family)
MSLSVDEIEAEALKLPEASRAELLERLMLSFQKSPEWDDQIARTWAEEAERRDQEMTATGDEGVPAEEVFRQLRSRRA